MVEQQLSYRRDNCRLCGSRDLWKSIPTAPLPVASPNVGTKMVVQETASADVFQCRGCGHIQLETIVDPEFQYRNFRYVTGISLGLRTHFEELVSKLAAKGDIAPDKFVVDIGSNDGSLLRFAKAYGSRVLGIDPAEQIARDATDAGIPTLAAFFSPELANEIVTQHGRADVIISNNTIANIDDLDRFFVGVDTLLAADGVVVMETQYALDVLTKTLLDVIYHEHVSYFSVKPVDKFLRTRGFELIGAERIAPKGGSIRFIVQRRGGRRNTEPDVMSRIREENDAGLYDERIFREFNARIRTIGIEVRQRLMEARSKSGRGLAYGASVGCVALIHYLGLGELIDAIFDDSPLTSVVRTGQRDIPVLSGHRLIDEPPTCVVVLAWRYAPVIAREHEAFRQSGGHFVQVLPQVALVDENIEPNA